MSLLPLAGLATGCFGKDERITGDQATNEDALTDQAVAPEQLADAFTKYLLDYSDGAPSPDPRLFSFDIDKLVAEQMDFIYEHVIAKVFSEIATEEVAMRSDIDSTREKYHQSVFLPSENGCPAGSAGEYKCSHLVHFVATRCGIQDPSEQELLGNDSVLRTVHLTDIIFLKYPDRDLMNITSDGTPMNWRQSHLTELEKYITVEYTKTKDEVVDVASELKKLHDKLQAGKILIMVWSPLAGQQYGHEMIIKRIPYVIEANNQEAVPFIPYDARIHRLHDPVYVIEAGSNVTADGRRSIVESGRDVAVFSYQKSSLNMIPNFYHSDEQLKQTFNRVFWDVVAELDGG